MAATSSAKAFAGRMVSCASPIDTCTGSASRGASSAWIFAWASARVRPPTSTPATETPGEYFLPDHRRAHEQGGTGCQHDERYDQGGFRRTAAPAAANRARGPGGDLGHRLRRVSRNAVTIIRLRGRLEPAAGAAFRRRAGRPEGAEALAAQHGRPLVVAAARAALAAAREDVQSGYPAGDLVQRTASELAERLRPNLRRVLNATGVVVHTNLGRAPLADAALERVREIATGYSNLEFDLGAGSRGSRQDHVAAVLRELSGAEAALVVNNNAAAVLLALAALAEGREVVVSRGELIEIGDGFQDSRRPRPLGRDPGRGGYHQPDEARRLRAGDHRPHGRSPARPSVELPHGGLHGAAPSARPRQVGRAAWAGSGRRPRLGSTRRGRRRADSRGEHRGRRTRRYLLRRQAARRPPGRYRGRTGGPDRAPAPPSAPAGAACRQVDAGRARRHAHALPRREPRAPGPRMLEESPDAVRARAERLAELIGGDVVETTARSGAARSPSRRSRATRARFRLRWRSRCGRASRRWSGSCATTGSCSTAAP